MVEHKSGPVWPDVSFQADIAALLAWMLKEGGSPPALSPVFSRDRLKANAANGTGLNLSGAALSLSHLKGNTMSSHETTLRPIRFIRLPEVMHRTGLSKMTITREEPEGRFPQRRKIGKHAVAWVEAEIDDWCEKRAAGEPWGGER